MVKVKLEDLVISRYNVRTTVDPQYIENLAKDIAKRGLINPLIVLYNEKIKKYEIVCGKCRFLALQWLKKNMPDIFESKGLEYVDVVVKELAPVDAILLSLSENIYQNTITEKDIARAISILEVEHKLPTEKIAEQLAMPLEKIERLKKIYIIKKYIVAGPGRPAEDVRSKKISRIQMSFADEIADILDKSGLVKDRSKFVDDFLEKTRGMATKQLRQILKEVRRRPRDYQKIIDEICSVKKVTMLITIRKDIADKVKKMARERKITLDQCIESILRSYFHL